MSSRITLWLGSLPNLRLLVMCAVLAGMSIVFEILTDGLFFRPINIYNLAQQTAVVGVICSVAMLIIVSRNIDLSVGSVLGFVGVLIAWLQYTMNWAWPWAVLVGLLISIVIGVYHGFITAYIGVPSFIVTLGGLMSFRGGAFLVASGKTQPVSDPAFLMIGGGIDGAIGVTASYTLAVLASLWIIANMMLRRRQRARYSSNGKPLWQDLLVALLSIGALFGLIATLCDVTIGSKTEPQGVPVPVLLWALSAWFISFLCNRTRFGRYVYAIGGNPEAAELVGIPVKRVIVLLYALMGVLITLAACMAVARLNAGTNSLGSSMELYVIAATVVGGTTLMGGSGSIAGVIVGALLMQVLDSGMLLLDVSIGMRMVIIGQALIVAVVFDVLYRKHFGDR